LTRYPVLKVREAQTQILLKSGDSAVIGGLQSELERDSEYGVPWLKDIPFLGVLFKRTTTSKEKIELLIFIKATIVEEATYAVESAQLQDEWDTRAGFKAEEAVEEEAVEPADEEIAEIPAEEKDEMVSFISGESEAEAEQAEISEEEIVEVEEVVAVEETEEAAPVVETEAM